MFSKYGRGWKTPANQMKEPSFSLHLAESLRVGSKAKTYCPLKPTFKHYHSVDLQYNSCDCSVDWYTFLGWPIVFFIVLQIVGFLVLHEVKVTPLNADWSQRTIMLTERMVSRGYCMCVLWKICDINCEVLLVSGTARKVLTLKRSINIEEIRSTLVKFTCNSFLFFCYSGKVISKRFLSPAAQSTGLFC